MMKLPVDQIFSSDGKAASVHIMIRSLNHSLAEPLILYQLHDERDDYLVSVRCTRSFHRKLLSIMLRRRCVV